jgi:flagellar hook-associated protein 3 FlgL
MMVDNLLAGMSGAASRIQRYQTQLATGKRVNQPSDDPIGVIRILALRSGIERAQTYLNNVAQAREWMTVSETALQGASSVLAQAQECAQRGATEVLTEDGRRAIAREVSGLIDELLAVANTNYLGRYVFAGTNNDTAPFALTGEPPTGWTFSGNAGELRWDIEPQTDMVVNSPGEAIFGGAEGPFAALIRLRDDLLAGNVAALTTDDLSLIDSAHTIVLNALGDLGANSRRLDQAGGRLEHLHQAFVESLSGYEDADMAEAIINLQLAESAYGAAQGVAARLVRPTLVDLLR